MAMPTLFYTVIGDCCYCRYKAIRLGCQSSVQRNMQSGAVSVATQYKKHTSSFKDVRPCLSPWYKFVRLWVYRNQKNFNHHQWLALSEIHELVASEKSL